MIYRENLSGLLYISFLVWHFIKLGVCVPEFQELEPAFELRSWPFPVAPSSTASSCSCPPPDSEF